MRIAICDDHKETVSQLSQSVKEYFAQQPDMAVTICEYYDGQGLLDGYDTQQYDIIFLDIEMPGLSGMDVAKELRLRGCDALLVFVTAYAEFMAASFHVEAFDFLTKPVSDSDMARVLGRCVQKLNQLSGTMIVKTGNGTAVVRLREVLYIASSKHHLSVVLRDGTVIRSMMTLSQMEDSLKAYPQFIRCHQSYIMNIDYVAELCREHFAMQPIYQSIIEKVPISRKYAETVKDRFFRYYLNQV